MNLTMKVEGLDELNRRLNRLESKQIKKIVRSSAMKSTTPMVRAMKSNVEVDDGHLKKSIGRQSRFFRKGKFFSMKIGIRSKQVADDSWINVYGPMLEYGTLKMSAKPWMRPAFDEHANPTILRFRDEMAGKLRNIGQ